MPKGQASHSAQNGDATDTVERLRLSSNIKTGLDDCRFGWIRADSEAHVAEAIQYWYQRVVEVTRSK